MLGKLHNKAPTAKYKKFRFSVLVTDAVTNVVLLRDFILDAEIEPQFKTKTSRIFIARHKLISDWRSQLCTGFDCYNWLKPWFSSDLQSFLHNIDITEIGENIHG